MCKICKYCKIYQSFWTVLLIPGVQWRSWGPPPKFCTRASRNLATLMPGWDHCREIKLLDEELWVVGSVLKRKRLKWFEVCVCNYIFWIFWIGNKLILTFSSTTILSSWLSPWDRVLSLCKATLSVLTECTFCTDFAVIYKNSELIQNFQGMFSLQFLRIFIIFPILDF